MPRLPSDPSVRARRADDPAPRADELRVRPRAPDGVKHVTSLEGEELHFPRRRPTHFIQVAIILGIVATGVAAAGFVGGFEEVSLFVMGLAIVGGLLLRKAHQRLGKAPPLVVRLSHQGLLIDGESVPWDDVQALQRTHTGNGGGVVVATAEHGYLLGGRLRPSGVDWLEGLLARHRSRARGGHIDAEGRQALESMRSRPG